MSRVRSASLLFALAFALPGAAMAQQGATVVAGAAQAPGMRAGGGAVEVRARVVEVDPAARTATLRGPGGQVMTVGVPPEMKAFDTIKVGDTVLVRYATAVAARLEPTSGSGIRERVESEAAAAAPAGSAPGVAARRTVEVLAQVQSIDRKNRTATLRGVHRTVKVAVPEGVDMSKIKTGDEVRAVITEAVVLALEPAPVRQAAPKR